MDLPNTAPVILPLRKLKHPIFENFHVLGVMEIEKTEASDFCEISCIRGHENSRKVRRLIFEKFHLPR